VVKSKVKSQAPPSGQNWKLQFSNSWILFKLGRYRPLVLRTFSINCLACWAYFVSIVRLKTFRFHLMTFYFWLKFMLGLEVSFHARGIIETYAWINNLFLVFTRGEHFHLPDGSLLIQPTRRIEIVKVIRICVGCKINEMVLNGAKVRITSSISFSRKVQLLSWIVSMRFLFK